MARSSRAPAPDAAARVAVAKVVVAVVKAVVVARVVEAKVVVRVAVAKEAKVAEVRASRAVASAAIRWGLREVFPNPNPMSIEKSVLLIQSGNDGTMHHFRFFNLKTPLF